MYDYANDEYDYVSKDDHDNSGFGKWDRSGKAFHLTDDDDDDEEEEDMNCDCDDDVRLFLGLSIMFKVGRPLELV